LKRQSKQNKNRRRGKSEEDRHTSKKGILKGTVPRGKREGGGEESAPSISGGKNPGGGGGGVLKERTLEGRKEEGGWEVKKKRLERPEFGGDDRFGKTPLKKLVSGQGDT